LSGVALELSPTEAFVSKDERSRLPLSTFWGHVRGAPHALVQILALSVVLEILVIASPFYMQLTIDEVITRGDVDLLLILGPRLRAAERHYGRVHRSSITDRPDRAEHTALRDRRKAVSPSRPLAPVLLREAAHWGCPVPVRVNRANPNCSRKG
jgi:hypothetical protein